DSRSRLVAARTRPAQPVPGRTVEITVEIRPWRHGRGPLRRCRKGPLIWSFSGWRGQDLNLRPSGYEPDELPDCSTPRRESGSIPSREVTLRRESVRRGCLVVADISGYTRDLGGTELEHSRDVLANLVAVVVDALSGSRSGTTQQDPGTRRRDPGDGRLAAERRRRCHPPRTSRAALWRPRPG